MKRVNHKIGISYILEYLGVIGWVLGLCVQSNNDELPFVLVNFALLGLSTVLIALAFKLNSERSREVLITDCDEKVNEKIYHKSTTASFTTYVMDGDTPIPIHYPLTDWDKAYLIAWQLQKGKGI